MVTKRLEVGCNGDRDRFLVIILPMPDRDLAPSDAVLDRLNADCQVWLLAIADGDQAALAALYDATLGKSYALALRITRRPDGAEEALLDLYQQVWREARHYNPARGRPLAWLMTLCRSRALDWLRRQDLACAHPAPETLAEVELGPDPADLLQAVERKSALHRALRELPSVQCQLLALAYFRGLTQEEIAAYERMPLGTVKTHIRKALAALREKLAAQVTSL